MSFLVSMALILGFAGFLVGMVLFWTLGRKIHWLIVSGIYCLAIIAVAGLLLPSAILAAHYIPHVDAAGLGTNNWDTTFAAAAGGVGLILGGLLGLLWGVLGKRRARLNAGETHAV